MKNNRRNTDLVHQHVRISSLRQSLYPVYDAIRCVYEYQSIAHRQSREGYILVVLELTHIVVKRRHCYVKVTSASKVAPQRMQAILGVYFFLKKWESNGDHELFFSYVRMG